MEEDKFDQNLIPILSIDGGGIRGIISAVIISFLESELQELDGPNARLANYFYMIAGTSIDSFMTAMLTCPSESGRPLLAAKEIIKFYMKESPKIFPQPRHVGMLRCLEKAISFFRGPKYDGEHLHTVIRRLLGKNRLYDTLTNVVIVAYDTVLRDAIIFSSYERAKNHEMELIRLDPKKRGFSYLDIFTEGRNAILNRYLPAAIKTLHADYLRIQYDMLSGDLSSMDIAIKDNLENLVMVDEELLREPVSTRNPKICVLELCYEETNAKALIRIAKLLSKDVKHQLVSTFTGN